MKPHERQMENVGIRLAQCLVPLRTTREVAAMLGMCKQNVSHIERKALYKIERKLRRLEAEYAL